MENASQINRRLAAVVFADVVGYTRLVAANDIETLKRWKALRTEIMVPYVDQQGGRVAELMGDGLLVEFPSAVNALQWAIDVQRSVITRESESTAMPLSLRIGITVDDVIDDEGFLTGDGVNIAARLHQVAEPGQIIVTAAVQNYVQNKLPAIFHDMGTPPLKNVSRPVHLFAVSWADPKKEVFTRLPYLHWSTRPTIAVLPFRNVRGTEDEAYFGEGITDDIVTGLSRSHSLYVIARTSTLRYRDRTMNLRQMAGELDVRYVLDGSVRRQAKRLRINAELIDVAANRSVWAERFDGANDDLFEFQDSIVSSIVGSLEPRLRAVEAARVRGRPTESLDAYDCVLKALSYLYHFTDESYRITGDLLDRAIMLDPSYAHAYAYSAWRLNFLVGECRSADPEADKTRAIEDSQRAIELDPDDAFALTVAGHIRAFLRNNTGEAQELFESALTLNENSAFAWAMSALTFAYEGRPDEAQDRLRNVWRLSPFDPLNFYFWIVAGIAEFVAGRYSESIAWLNKSKRANPRFVACLRMSAASLALAGDEAGARATALELLAAEPTFRVSSFLEWYPLQRAADLERLAAGLRLAGVPED